MVANTAIRNKGISSFFISVLFCVITIEVFEALHICIHASLEKVHRNSVFLCVERNTDANIPDSAELRATINFFYFNSLLEATHIGLHLFPELTLFLRSPFNDYTA